MRPCSRVPISRWTRARRVRKRAIWRRLRPRCIAWVARGYRVTAMHATPAPPSILVPACSPPATAPVVDIYRYKCSMLCQLVLVKKEDTNWARSCALCARQRVRCVRRVRVVGRLRRPHIRAIGQSGAHPFEVSLSDRMWRTPFACVNGKSCCTKDIFSLRL